MSKHKLNDYEIGILSKIADHSGMDAWFAVREDGQAILDLEEGETLSLTEGIGQLSEGMTGYEDYGLNADEIDLFEDLLAHLGLESKA